MGNSPLIIRRKDIFLAKDYETPTPEIVVVPNDDQGLCNNLTDHQIEAKIERILMTLSSKTSENLSDKGEKLRAILSQYQAELDLWKLRARKVQDVVLLDDEVEPNQLMLGDTPDDWKEARIYYPSRDHPECIELSYADIKCLGRQGYLTSPIMNFYIRYLQKPLSPIGRKRGEYYVFNTFFYKKLEEAVSVKSNSSARFVKLRRWWKGVNIFEKAYIFVPIHGDMHWSLVIICIPAKEDESGPIVLHLDSLGMHPSDMILNVICNYLKEEWNCINIDGVPPDLPISKRIWRNLPRRIERKRLMVPQQKNEYDCGLFVLYYMERFILEAPERLKRKDLAMFGSEWFQPEEASNLRKRIKDLLNVEFVSDRLKLDGNLDPSTSSSSSAESDVQHFIEI